VVETLTRATTATGALRRTAAITPTYLMRVSITRVFPPCVLVVGISGVVSCRLTHAAPKQQLDTRAAVGLERRLRSRPQRPRPSGSASELRRVASTPRGFRAAQESSQRAMNERVDDCCSAPRSGPASCKPSSLPGTRATHAGSPTQRSSLAPNSVYVLTGVATAIVALRRTPTAGLAVPRCRSCYARRPASRPAVEALDLRPGTEQYPWTLFQRGS
jgi:hypothetical protein